MPGPHTKFLTVPDDPASAVDIRDLQTRRFGRPQTRGIGRGQGGSVPNARNSLQKPHDLVRAQYDWQPTRLPRVGDPLGQIGSSQGHAKKETQGADGLVQTRPRHLLRNQMHLELMDLGQAQPLRRPSKISAKLRNVMHVRLLRRRRQIADTHVFNHTTTQRAQLGHLGVSCLRGLASQPNLLRQGPTRASPAMAISRSDLVQSLISLNMSQNQFSIEIPGQISMGTDKIDSLAIEERFEFALNANSIPRIMAGVEPPVSKLNIPVVVGVVSNSSMTTAKISRLP